VNSGSHIRWKADKNSLFSSWNILAILLIGSILIALLTVHFVVASDTLVYVDPPICEVAVGETFSIEVKIKNVTELYYFYFLLSYNTTQMDCLDVFEGSFLADSGPTICDSEINETEGWVYLFVSLVDPLNAASGNGTLAELAFECTFIGGCMLNLEETFLSDPSGLPIPHATAPGYCIQYGDMIYVQSVYVDNGFWMDAGEVVGPPNYVYAHSNYNGPDRARMVLDFGATYVSKSLVVYHEDPYGDHTLFEIKVWTDLAVPPSSDPTEYVGGEPEGFWTVGQVEGSGAIVVAFDYDIAFRYVLVSIFSSLPGEYDGIDAVGFFDLLPTPWLVCPLENEVLYGNSTEVAAVEKKIATDIIYSSFEYSSDGSNWTLIGIDNNETDCWSLEWNITDILEGQYFVRVTMTDLAGQVGGDQIQIFVDPTPPIPEFVSPLDFDVVSGTVTFELTTVDEDVVYTNVEYRYCNGDGMPPKCSIEDLCQYDLGKWMNDNKAKTGGDPFNGKTSCGPTAAANCLAYWDKAFPGLYDESSSDGLETMGSELYRQMRCGSGGTNAGQVEIGIDGYIRGKLGKGELNANKATQQHALELIIKKFQECEDILVNIKWPNVKAGHWVTLKHVVPQRGSDGKISDTPSSITAMDPNCGQKVTATEFSGTNQMKYNGSWVYIYEIVYVSPLVPVEGPSCTVEPQSVGQSGSFVKSDNGVWDIEWDTRKVPDGYYLVNATMVDSMGMRGTTINLVYVENVRVTEVTPIKTVVGEKFTTNINVTIENSFISPVSGNVTVYCNDTSIGTQSIYVANESSTTEIFVWNTTGFALGDYNISAKINIEFNETARTTSVFEDGVITITIPGDVDGNFEVDIFDVTAICICYDTKQGQPGYHPQYDVDGNGEIDIFDITIACINYAQKYP
jgi:hypothetical protein